MPVESRIPVSRRLEQVITTHSAAETRRLGRLLGRQLQTGIVLRLSGGLGCGKTCFVQGLAQGLDVPAEYPVTSPTYALMHDFPGRLTLIHVDLYRLHDATDAENIGLWEAMDGQAVVAIEWANRLDEIHWPDASLQIAFERPAAQTRSIALIGCGLQMVNLIKQVGTLWPGKQPAQ
jgi:tRNA threonylcarbamoyladenosine biosynthesis protein TsaE